MAIDTGIHVSAITMFRLLDHFQVAECDVCHFKRDFNCASRFSGLSGFEKGGFKKKGQDINALGPYQISGHHAVEAP